MLLSRASLVMTRLVTGQIRLSPHLDLTLVSSTFNRLNADECSKHASESKRLITSR